jgi:hydroxysqualene synthase
MEGAHPTAERRLMSATVETPSGKAARDENFPVGSWLIRAELRPHVHAFYRFAREADDIADNAALSPEEKLHRLDRMGEVLEGGRGDDAPSARAMRDSLIETGVTAQHCHDILRAFRLDATKLRYKDWDDLMGYCRYSASPVGRQVLDLHAESRDTWPSNDALCSALQVLNHLQDCVADYHNLDRVYLPTELLERFGSRIEDLDLPAVSPGLRATIDHLLDRTAELVREAHGLPPRVVSAGLRRETAVIVNLAERLTARLRRGDPVAGRVKLTPYDFGASVLVGLWRGRLSRRLP